MYDHDLSFRKEDGISNFAKHFLIETDHVFNTDFEILHVENKGLKLNALESLEINRLKNNDILLNDQIDINSSPLLNLV